MSDSVRTSAARLRTILQGTPSGTVMVQVRASDLRNTLAALNVWTDDATNLGWALAKMDDGYFLRRKGWPPHRDLRMAFEHEVRPVFEPNRPEVTLVQRDGVELQEMNLDDVLSYDWELAE